ncbi:uncharacterized protein EAE97_011702 [Botrytis byssoidea]|uniref:LysM domain-containing protein n=1 Tax=Botrytis byssoidea TaxID=139641 RepID=A0A9P5LGT7_9HELO|nr:uncharacterized protein EAE97_011702 [Botrytis byssoidea]KAF7919370.1 hypothetical protein EAE97_011702 [Botrytis byssoidea]
MVQLSTIAIILASALSSIVAAKSCNTGGIYCGTYLLKRGDYITKINTNLLANNLPTSDLYVKQSLWACIEHGDIKLLEFCAAGCVGGDKNDDYCTGTGAPASKRDEVEEDLTEEDFTGEDLTEEDLTEEELVERAVSIEWKA